MSAVGSFVTLQTLRLYQKRQSANREIRKTLVKDQTFLFVDDILQRFKQREVTFFVAEAKKSLHSCKVHTQLRDLGTDDFEQTFCQETPEPSRNAPSVRVTVLPKLSQPADKGDFTFEMLQKRLRKHTLTSSIPLMNASQKEIFSERWQFLQTTEPRGILKIPLFMPIFTFMGQKFDRKDTECVLRNPYDRPLKGILQFKCVAEVSDDQGNAFIDSDVLFEREVTLPPGGETTFFFDKHIPNLERLLHAEILNCPRAYERCAWNIPMTCEYGWPFQSPQHPTDEIAPFSPLRQPPNGVIFNTQTQPQRLDTCLLFHCDKLYHTVGQPERTFFADAQSSKDIPWNIFSQNTPNGSIPFYFFGTEEELFEMYPQGSDKEKLLEFFTRKTENSDGTTIEQPQTNSRPLSILQADIDTLVILAFFETQSDFCVCETELKYTSNNTPERQATRYYCGRKPKNYKKPPVSLQSPTAEHVILKSSDKRPEEPEISRDVVHPPKTEDNLPATPDSATVISEAPKSSAPIENLEKPVDEIVNNPSGKRRENHAPASMSFTRLQNDKRAERNTENPKKYPPDEDLNGLKPSSKINIPCDTNGAFDDPSSFRKDATGSKAGLNTDSLKPPKPSFDLKASSDGLPRSRKETAISDAGESTD